MSDFKIVKSDAPKELVNLLHRVENSTDMHPVFDRPYDPGDSSGAGEPNFLERPERKPKDRKRNNAIIFERKVRETKKEKNLETNERELFH